MAAFFRINTERFKMTSVSSYSFVPTASVSTGKFYVSIMFGKRERLFAFDTRAEAQNVIDYLDSVFKVTVI